MRPREDKLRVKESSNKELAKIYENFNAMNQDLQAQFTVLSRINTTGMMGSYLMGGPSAAGAQTKTFDGLLA